MAPYAGSREQINADRLRHSVQRLWEGDNDGSRVLGRCLISKKLATSLGIGWHGNHLSFPIQDKNNNIVNVMTVLVKNGVRAPEFIPDASVPNVYPPLPEAESKKPTVVVATPLEAICGRGYGINTVCILRRGGGLAGKLLSGSEVIFAFPAGNKHRRVAWQMARQLHEQSVVRFATVPGSLCDFLRNLPEDQRRESWEAAARDADAYVQNSALAINGIAEANFRMVDDGRGDILAEWVGRITKTGMERIGNDQVGERAYKIELVNADKQTLEVTHRHSDDLSASISRAPGFEPVWNIRKSDSDRIFNYISRASVSHVDTADIGYVFGWLDGVERFVSGDLVFEAGVARDNDLVDIQPPNSFLGRFRMPRPNSVETAKGIRLLLDDVYPAHNSPFMASLIAVALLAPVRRRLLPMLPRFNTFLRGSPESGKTSRALLVQNMFGEFTSSEQVPSFEATAHALRLMMSSAGDCMMLVDDWSPTRINALEVKAYKQMFQGVQGMGRFRLQQDGVTLNEQQQAHCLPVMTVEAMPDGDAALTGRSLRLDVERARTGEDDLQQKRWMAAWTERDLLRPVMAAWVQDVSGWPSPDDRGTEFLARTEPLVVQTLEDLNPGWSSVQNSARLKERLAGLTACWWMFLEWCRRSTGVNASRLDDLLEDWEGVVLPTVAAWNLNEIVAESTKVTVSSYLERALSGGSAAFVYGNNQRAPEHAASNATIVGRLVEAVDGPVKIGARRYRAHIFPSVADIFPGGNTSWPTARTVLADSGLIEKGASERIREDGKQVRAPAMTARGHRDLTQVLGLNYLRSPDSTEPPPDS